MFGLPGEYNCVRFCAILLFLAEVGEIMNISDDERIENHSIVTAQDMRSVMRQWTTGVTIVSSHWHGEQHGMTVSSFTSISLEPPLVSVSLGYDTRTFRLIESSGVFGVTILSEAQQEISDRFAGRIEDTQDRFSGLETFKLSTGSPFIPGGLAYLDCKVVSKFEAGKNFVFLGKVILARTGGISAPLLYYDRDYRNICD